MLSFLLLFKKVGQLYFSRSVIREIKGILNGALFAERLEFLYFSVLEIYVVFIKSCGIFSVLRNVCRLRFILFIFLHHINLTELHYGFTAQKPLDKFKKHSVVIPALKCKLGFSTLTHHNIEAFYSIFVITDCLI